MAAPGYLYKGKLTAQGVADSKIILMTASSGTDKELMKSRFYLDFFISLDQLGATGMSGQWAGACYVGSENYYMHNISRHGWMEITHNNQKAIVFWDAGLNTLGIVNFRDWIAKSPNNLVADMLYKSSWWNDTTSYGFDYKREGEMDWKRVQVAGSISKQSEVNGGVRMSDAPILPLTYYDFRFYLTNEEGTKLTDPVLVRTDDMVYGENFYKQSIPCGPEGDMVLLYFREQDRIRMNQLADTEQTVLPPIIGYMDSNFTIVAGEGWYKSFLEDYTYFNSSQFGFNTRRYCAPPVAYRVKITVTVTQPQIFQNMPYTVFAEVIGGVLGANVTFTGVLTGSSDGVGVYSIPISITLGASQTTNSYSDVYLGETSTTLTWLLTGLSSSNTAVVPNEQIQSEVIINT